MDCGGGAQRAIFHQLVDLGGGLFFVPTAYIVVELSTRFPEEGGLYVWTKMAFGDFHGFVAGWTYWIYTVFYFPGLLIASAAMAAYVGGGGNGGAGAEPHVSVGAVHSCCWLWRWA